MEQTETFGVTQWFANGMYETPVEHVTAPVAIEKFRHYCTSVGARIGTTVRVILTDEGDSVCMEWERDKGVTFPPEFAGLMKGGQR